MLLCDVFIWFIIVYCYLSIFSFVRGRFRSYNSFYL